MINNASQVGFLASADGVIFGMGLSRHFLSIDGKLAVRAGEAMPVLPSDGGAASATPYYFDLFTTGHAMNELTQIALPLDGPGIVSWYAKLSGVPTAVDRTGGVFFGFGRLNPCTIGYAEAARQGMNGVVDGGGDNRFTYASMATGPNDTCRFAYGADTATGSMIGASQRNLESLGTEWPIATSGATIAPDAGFHPGGEPVRFTHLKFSPAINNAGDIAFRAQTDLNGQWGVWRADLAGGNYTLSKVVYAADAVPGVASGEWLRFGDPVVNAQGDLVFLGRFTQEISDGQGGVQTVTDDAVWRATAAGVLTRVVQTGLLAPKFDQSGFVGRFTGLADPEFNGEGNIAFLADLDIMDPTLRARLDSFDPLFVEEQGIFYTEPSGAMRSIVTSGMTLAELIGGAGDGRVIVDLKYAANETRIDDTFTLEAVASGHQDGRRCGMTRLSSYVNGASQSCTKLSIAFVAVFMDPITEALSEGVFIADIEDCTTGGGGCGSCLCSTDPNCEFGMLTLGGGPDYDQNGLVDDTDLSLMMMAIGMKGGRFDMDGDGLVGEKDLALLVEDYGTTIGKE